MPGHLCLVARTGKCRVHLKRLPPPLRYGCIAPDGTRVPTDKYPLGISKDVETGALVHAPSATELAGWRVRRTLLGGALLLVGVLGLYLGVMGLTEDPKAGGGATLTSILTLGASVAIGFFGVRYLLLGIKG